jgi:hypothetical protein
MKLPTPIIGMFYKTKGFFIKNSPIIMITAGFAATVAAGVLAVVNTPKVTKQYNERKELLERVDDCLKNGHTDDGKDYSATDAMNDIRLINHKSAITVVKSYLPSVGLAILGGVLIFGGHRINVKRLSAMSAAYAALDEGFRRYRKNVVDRFGEEIEGQIRSGFDPDKKDASKEVSNDDLSSIVDKPAGFGPYSGYSKIFDETNVHWKDSAVYNRMFLDSVEREANDKLRIRGFLFLNEVYDALGFDHTAAGQIVGWVYDSSRGDSRIRFEHDNKTLESSCRFINGEEASVILDFNVDGPILDHFGRF